MELAMEEESGTCAHCRKQGGIYCTVYWALGCLDATQAAKPRGSGADLIRGVQCGSRLNPPQQPPCPFVPASCRKSLQEVPGKLSPVPARLRI